jgi:hypothetical protein
MPNMSRSAATIVALVALASACVTEDPPGAGDPCSPNAANCADGLVCCSIDAAALDFDDLEATVLPMYPGFNELGGIAIFSDHANDRSHRGICINSGNVPPAAMLPNVSCPVPCNPTWSTADIETVCGANMACCQMMELQPDDCVLDPSLGDDGCWRPVTGADIGVLTDWGAHATEQDPGLLSDGACASLVAGLPPELDADAVREACERRLTVANQQGFCVLSGGYDVCPHSRPSYRDACERLNDEQSRSGC